MRTDQLIDRLADQPTQGPAPATTLAGALGLGVAVSFVVMLAWLRLRPDLIAAATTAAFWMKLVYAAATATIAFLVAEHLSRPTGSVRPSALLVVLPLLVLLGFALIQLGSAAQADRMHLLMGNSWTVCPGRIIVLSLPILGVVFAAFRRLAPTNLAAAGVAAGLLAGAAGTVVYALHCDESAAPFVVVWYTLGMASVGLLGGLLGRPLLRW
jgi:hypothetical protein